MSSRRERMTDRCLLWVVAWTVLLQGYQAGNIGAGSVMIMGVASDVEAAVKSGAETERTKRATGEACADTPCMHGGTCSDETDGSYSCLCAEGHHGTDCRYADNARLVFVATVENSDGTRRDQMYFSYTSPTVFIQNDGQEQVDYISIGSRDLRSFASMNNHDFYLVSDPTGGVIVAVVNRTTDLRGFVVDGDISSQDWVFLVSKEENGTAASLRYYKTDNYAVSGSIMLSSQTFIDISQVMVTAPSLQPLGIDDPCSEKSCAHFCIAVDGVGDCFCADGFSVDGTLCNELTITSTPAPQQTTPRVDPCAVNRGGCEQYCTSQGDEVTCVCSDSFVLSLADSKTCVDPCEADNGGCSQLCSVDSRQQVVCGCHDGYSTNPADSTQCIEENECENVTCKNGGTCEDLVNMFLCKCTAGWAGQYCQQQIIFEPELADISPLKGPVAGKSRLRLTGDHFVEGVVVRLGAQLVCTFISSTSTSASVLTPAVNETLYADRALAITVEFPGYAAINTGLLFTYRGNPKLKSLQPLEVHARGGTNITVVGEQLDVIAEPLLELTMVHTFLEEGKVQPPHRDYSSPCIVSSDAVMSCLSPPVADDIPEAFRNWDEERSMAQMVTSRKRRSSSSSSGSRGRYRRDVATESDFTLVLPDQTLDFYLGFTLDGFREYQDLSDTKDMFEYSKALVHATPPVVNTTDFPPFVPYSGEKIHITGEGFTRGFQESDYKVSIGSGWCNVTEVTYNKIICAPPDEPPADTSAGEDTEKQVDVPESCRKRNVPAQNQIDVPESRKKRNPPAENQVDVPESRRKRNVPAENQVDVPESRKKRNVPAEKQDVDDASKSRKKRATRKVPLTVVVHAGTGVKLEAGTLTYHVNDSPDLAIILASVFAAIAVIIIAILVGCCVYRRHVSAPWQDKQQRPAPSRFSSGRTGAKHPGQMETKNYGRGEPANKNYLNRRERPGPRAPQYHGGAYLTLLSHPQGYLNHPLGQQQHMARADMSYLSPLPSSSPPPPPQFKQRNAPLPDFNRGFNPSFKPSFGPWGFQQRGNYYGGQ